MIGVGGWNLDDSIFLQSLVHLGWQCIPKRRHHVLDRLRQAKSRWARTSHIKSRSVSTIRALFKTSPSQLLNITGIIITTIIMHFSTFIFTSMAAGYANAFTGRGTFYGGNVQGGMCSFASYTLPTGIDGTAISKLDWAGSGVCGACIKVTGLRGSTISMV